MNLPWRADAQGTGILIKLRLTPRASRDAIDGVKRGSAGSYVQARVRAVAQDGRANDALVELVAGELRVPRSTVSIAAGHTARLKTLRITGDTETLRRCLELWFKRMA